MVGIKTPLEELEQESKEQKEKAYQYLDVRIENAKYKNYLERELVIRINKYRSKKSNLGVEMAHLWRYEDAVLEKDQEYIDIYEKFGITLATYKGLDRVLDTLKTRVIAIQGSIKRLGDAGQFGSYE